MLAQEKDVSQKCDLEKLTFVINELEKDEKCNVLFFRFDSLK